MLNTFWNQQQPYAPQIPTQLTQGDSATWTDGPFRDYAGNQIGPVGYTYAYTIAGPNAPPIVLTGTVSGSAWSVTLTTAQSLTMNPGLYNWAAEVTAAGVQVTVGTGQLRILLNPALQTAAYDARTKMQKALEDAETAIANYAASGRFMKRYMIGQRSMEFSDPKELQSYADWLRARVQMERAANDGGKSRRLLTRFNRA